MKRFLTLALAASIALMSSCSKDDSSGNRRSGEVDFKVRTSLSQDIKTYASHEGGIKNVDPANYDLRYILEVWTKESPKRLAYREVKSTNAFTTSTEMTFEARLLAMDYDFVFWADFVNRESQADKFYNTGNTLGLRDIEMIGTYGLSNDARDAYYAVENIDLTNAGANVANIALQRPFGKIRLIATDAVNGELQDAPLAAKIDYAAATFPGGFDALSGVVTSRTIDVSGVYDSQVSEKQTVSVGGQSIDNCYVLAFDYIFASSQMEAAALNVKCFGDAAATQQIGSKDISAIPVGKNKLTTVIGNLYTYESKVTIYVDGDFEDPEIVQSFIEVETVADVRAALAEGKNSIKVTLPGDGVVVIPAGAASGLVVDLSAGIPAGKTVTFTDEDSGLPYGGTITIVVPEESLGDLIIDLPGTHASLSGNYNSVTATTSATTLVIEKDATINELTVVQGNARILGAVGTLTKGNGYTGIITWAAGDAATFDKAFAQADTILLGAFTLTGDLTVNRPLAIRGSSRTASKIVGRVVCTKDLTLDNLNLSRTASNSTTNLVFFDTDNVNLSILNCDLRLNRTTSTTEFLVRGTKQTSTLTMDNCTVTMQGVSTMIAIYTGAATRINNTFIQALDGTGQPYDVPSLDFRGFYLKNAPSLNLSNSTIKGMKYAYCHESSAAPGITTVAIDNSTLSGWAALYLLDDAKGAIIDVTNSVLEGRNVFKGASNSFSTIHGEQEGYASPAKNYTLTVTDSEIRTYQSDAATAQYAISFKVSTGNNKVYLKGNTRIVQTGEEWPINCVTTQDSWTAGEQTFYTFNVAPTVQGFVTNNEYNEL